MGMMILSRVMSRSDRWYPSSSRRSWKETNAGNPGLEQEDGSERRTENEEDTLSPLACSVGDTSFPAQSST